MVCFEGHVGERGLEQGPADSLLLGAEATSRLIEIFKILYSRNLLFA